MGVLKNVFTSNAFDFEEEIGEQALLARFGTENCLHGTAAKEGRRKMPSGLLRYLCRLGFSPYEVYVLAEEWKQGSQLGLALQIKRSPIISCLPTYQNKGLPRTILLPQQD